MECGRVKPLVELADVGGKGTGPPDGTDTRLRSIGPLNAIGPPAHNPLALWQLLPLPTSIFSRAGRAGTMAGSGIARRPLINVSRATIAISRHVLPNSCRMFRPSILPMACMVAHHAATGRAPGSLSVPEDADCARGGVPQIKKTGIKMLARSEGSVPAPRELDLQRVEQASQASVVDAISKSTPRVHIGTARLQGF